VVVGVVEVALIEEAPVAIEAVDMVFLSHVVIDFGVAQSATAAVAGDALALHDEEFGGVEGDRRFAHG
jgi:hypothetical protein